MDCRDRFGAAMYRNGIRAHSRSFFCFVIIVVLFAFSMVRTDRFRVAVHLNGVRALSRNFFFFEVLLLASAPGTSTASKGNAKRFALSFLNDLFICVPISRGFFCFVILIDLVVCVFNGVHWQV